MSSRDSSLCFSWKEYPYGGCLTYEASLLAHLLTSRNVQKSRAARTPEEFSARCAEDLAADLFHVYLKLSHGLAGIQNVEHAEPPTQVPHFR